MSYNVTTQTQDSVYISSGYLIYLSGQLPQVIRPFTPDVNGRTVQEYFDCTEGGRIRQSDEASLISNKLIYPSATPKGKIDLPNGFGTARFSFFLEVVINGTFGQRREIVTGYTDHADISINGKIDPNTTLYVTDIMTVSDWVNNHGHKEVTMNSNVQVLSNASFHGDAVHLIRPEDLPKAGQLNEYGLHPDDHVFDTRRTLASTSGVTNSKENSIPASYLNEVISAYQTTDFPPGSTDPYDEDSADSYDYVIGNLKSPSLARSEFYNTIRSYNGSINGGGMDNLTYATLINAFVPNGRDDFIKVIMPKNKMTLHTPANDTERWDGSSLVQQIAYSLAHVIPSILTNHYVVGAHISMTNMTQQGVMVNVMNPTQMFPNVLTEQMFNRMVAELKRHVGYGAFLSRVGTFMFEANVSVTTASTFKIRINGGEEVVFSAPSFASSMYPPIITNSSDDATKINYGIESMVSAMNSNRNVMHDNWSEDVRTVPIDESSDSYIDPTDSRHGDYYPHPSEYVDSGTEDWN